ncbi:hypothetical protein ACIA6D_23300 [Streptomyces cacaoi]
MARCPAPCGKWRYGSETTAQLACIQAALRGKPDLTWYRSKPCRAWHLTNPGDHGRGNGGIRGRWVRSFAPDQQ